tara:strand:- start:648 stop:836 length:189 start_codon:yes stop_codon:yes gene_type:complete
MTREEIILQTAVIKTKFNNDTMCQIINLANNKDVPHNLFLTKRDELLKLLIELTQEEKESLE